MYRLALYQSCRLSTKAEKTIMEKIEEQNKTRYLYILLLLLYYNLFYSSVLSKLVMD